MWRTPHRRPFLSGAQEEAVAQVTSVSDSQRNSRLLGTTHCHQQASAQWGFSLRTFRHQVVPTSAPNDQVGNLVLSLLFWHKPCYWLFSIITLPLVNSPASAPHPIPAVSSALLVDLSWFRFFSKNCNPSVFMVDINVSSSKSMCWKKSMI